MGAGKLFGCRRRLRGHVPLLVSASVLLVIVVLAALAAPAAHANGTLVVTAVDQLSSAPLAGIHFEIYPWNADPADLLPVLGATGDSGSTTVSLPAGAYAMYAYDPLKLHAPQWWERKTWWNTAGAITVTDGQQQSVDLSMPLGGHVSGTVTDTAGKPLAGMIVDVDPAPAYVLDAGGETTTDSNGHYDVGALDTGAYVVEARDISQGETYLYQFYPDQRSFWTATPFDVTAGQTTAGPTIKMKVAATISGTLTTHTGVVPHDVMCAVDRRNDDDTWTHEYGGACCNNNETYTVDQLPPGHYRLFFRWDSGVPNLPQYYKDTYWADQAVQFDLREGQQLIGMDAVIWGDTVAPTLQTPVAAAAKQDTAAGLRYRVKDTGRHGPTADVTIKIKTLAGKTVKVIRLAGRSVNQWHTYRYTCGLPKGKYRFCVWAVDSGGNRQKRIASNRLTVK